MEFLIRRKMFYGKKKNNVGVYRLLSVSFPLLYAAYKLSYFFEAKTWTNLILHAAVIGLTVLGIIWFVGLSGTSREALMKRAHQIILYR